MRILPFAELFKNDYMITNIEPHYQFWNTSGRWSTPDDGRSFSGLIFLMGCDAFYYRDKKLLLHAHSGDVVYLPKNARYTCVFSRTGGDRKIEKNADNYYVDGIHESMRSGMINAVNMRFDLLDKNGEYILLNGDLMKIEGFTGAYRHFSRLASMAITDAQRIPARLKANALEMLTELSLHLYSENLHGKYGAIKRAIAMLERSDIKDITVQSMSASSGLSVSHFRKLFCEYTGMSPVKYISRLKAERAHAMLASGGMSVADVAFMLGMSDTAYFSRFYKRETGRNPASDIKRPI